jgi:hypothetical protein
MFYHIGINIRISNNFDSIENNAFNLLLCWEQFFYLDFRMSITVAPSEARDAFSSSKAGIVGSNPTRGMDI